MKRERTQFLILRAAALEAQPEVLHLVLTYRTDNRTQVEQLVASSKSLSAIWNRETPQMREFELREMGVDGLRAVIEQPVRRYHVRLQPAEDKGRLEDTVFEGVRGSRRAAAALVDPEPDVRGVCGTLAYRSLYRPHPNL